MIEAVRSPRSSRSMARPSRSSGSLPCHPTKSAAAYRTTVENSVYVHRDFGGRGVGKQMMQELITTARAAGFHSIIARIEASSAASRALHTSCGYELVGIERQVGRKFSRWLDVAIMQLML